MHIRQLTKHWILNQQQSIGEDVIIKYNQNIVTIGMVMMMMMMIIVIMMVMMVVVKVIIMVVTNGQTNYSMRINDCAKFSNLCKL
jgi:hypothetical protein